MRSSTLRPSAFRFGWLLTTVAMAVALVTGAWINERVALDTVETLNRGQADQLERLLRGLPGLPDQADLAALVEANAASGLRYIAVVDTVGRVLVEAGEGGPIDRLPFDRFVVRGPRPGPPPPQLVDVGSRVRGFFARPRPRSAGPGAGGPASSGGPNPGGGPPGATRPGQEFWNVVEFEPLAAGLVSGATRTLAMSTGAAIALTLAALLFWRASLGQERASRRLEEQRRLAVLGEMSAVLAHEIRNPLASLKGNAQLLAEKVPESSRERARADRVVKEAERLEALTSDLLDFARTGPMQLQPTDPALVLRQAAEDAGSGVELVVDGAPPAWPLDGSRMRQALGNLLSNARQSTPAERVPRASVAGADAQLVFEVRDFGPGLPEGTETRIFEPFFTTRTSGTGLGLAVARRVAEMHGGAITARNHPDGGAVFRILIPAQS